MQFVLKNIAATSAYREHVGWINALTQAEKISISEMGYRINDVRQHLSAQTPLTMWYN
ncbi:hypothetical protein B0H13DRAFT_2351007 [Mycena leptocephala]|nr:hypothetical protein B0H13DRAFT_2351007 [Mycena leptocephala]